MLAHLNSLLVSTKLVFSVGGAREGATLLSFDRQVAEIVMTKQDVSMVGFGRRTSVHAAWQWVQTHCETLSSEISSLEMAAGRVLAEDILSDCNVPGFARAMMDGFATLATDIGGATDFSPVQLKLVGEAWPGQPINRAVQQGEAVQVMTGAPMPAGADVVVPVEMAERLEQPGKPDETVRVSASLPAGKHVGNIGEDIAVGQKVLPRGRRLRPQDLGVLSSIGFPQVPVVKRPKVRLCLTGNELLPAGSHPEKYRITDANSPLLRPLIQRDGGDCLFDGITPDDPDAILEVLQQPADVILVSGGSSVGAEDYAPQLIQKWGELPIHGISMRPSSPAGLGKIGQALVFLLPGNPVSCFCAYDFFAGRAIRTLAGRPKEWPYARTRACLRFDLSSKLGRLDYARVKLVNGEVEPVAIGGASVLSSTTRADGFVLVDENTEGHASGTEVEVYLYES